MRQYYLTYQDYLDIKAEAPDVKAVAPVISRGDIQAVSDYFTSSGQLMGVPASFNVIRYLPIADGRWLNPMDDAQKRLVVVLGDEARKLLFPGRPSVGSTILLNGLQFQVIGTLKRIGHGDNNTLNLRIFIPFNTMQRYFPPIGVKDASIRSPSSTISPERDNCMNKRNSKSTRSLPAIMDSIIAIPTPLMNGTAFAPPTRLERSLTP